VTCVASIGSHFARFSQALIGSDTVFVMGKCLFCRNSAKLTREHIWPDWLKHYLPRDRVNHPHLSDVIVPGRIERQVKLVSGDPRSRKLRCVCRDCNGGWMSRLQEKTKPILVDLIGRTHRKFTPDELVLLRSWIAMFVIVAEGMDRMARSIPQEDIEFLFTKKVAPLSWRIWIGIIDRKQWKTEYAHFVAAIGSSVSEEYVPHSSHGKIPSPNTQTTTLTVGEVFVHVMSTSNRKAQFVRA
jgi:hypothetical protein